MRQFHALSLALSRVRAPRMISFWRAHLLIPAIPAARRKRFNAKGVEDELTKGST